jgi:hypothetical protein
MPPTGKPQTLRQSNSIRHSSDGTRRGRVNFALCAMLLALAALTACGGSPSGFGGDPSPPPITVSVQPGSAKLSLGQTQQFKAKVTGISDTNSRGP